MNTDSIVKIVKTIVKIEYCTISLQYTSKQYMYNILTILFIE